MFDDESCSDDEDVSEDGDNEITFMETLQQDVGNEILFARRIQQVLDENLYQWYDVWNENTFHQEAEEEETRNSMWENIQECCADMSFKYERGNEPLFEGSLHKGKDLARFVLALKCKHYKWGIRP